MLFCGLRSFETRGVCYDDVKRTSGGDYMLFIGEGKDTRGGDAEGKSRETFLPDDLERDLRHYTDAHLDGDTSAPVVTVTTRTLRRWVNEYATAMAEKTGDERFLSLSTHDLRRSWAHHLTREATPPVPPRTVQQMGGWEDLATMEEYISIESAESVAESMRGVWG
jgi:integrase